MPVNLYIAVNPNRNFRVKNRDLHHGNESPWANVKHPIVATAQEGRTPKERTQDLGHIYSRVGGHIRFGDASQVHVPSVGSWSLVIGKQTAVGIDGSG